MQGTFYRVLEELILKMRRDLQQFVPYLLDILQQFQVEMTTSDIQRYFHDMYGIDLSTSDIRYIIEKEMDQGAHISKSKCEGQRPTYRWLQ